MLVIRTKLMMPVMVSVNLIHTSLYSCTYILYNKRKSCYEGKVFSFSQKPLSALRVPRFLDFRSQAYLPFCRRNGLRKVEVVF